MLTALHLPYFLVAITVFAVITNVSHAFIVARMVNEEVPAQCRILNHETVPDDTVPDTITVNGVQYRVYGQIQHGATSRVFHAVERMPTAPEVRCLAIKVVDMAKVEPEKENQLNNEAAILRELNARGVRRIPVLYTMEHNPSKSMSMVFELADHDLFDEITPKMGRHDHPWVRRTFHDILRAIQPVHANEIVHGDIKPENMAYFKPISGSSPGGADQSSDLVLKLIDFGGAMRARTLDSACEEIVTGTIMYMSPEQMAWCGQRGNEFVDKRREHQMSEKSDVWSVGIILYQMLYGHSPYANLLHQFDAVEEEAERAERTDAALRPAILHGTEPIQFGQYDDGAVLQILKKCLERCPEKRPRIDQLLAWMQQPYGPRLSNFGTGKRIDFAGQQLDTHQVQAVAGPGDAEKAFGNKMRVHFKDILMR
uniref:Protein kinase domain-containing protein n=1 Tax=Globodera pallida TaxID=36090 RepID=A0A183CEN3_GLOPA